MPNRWRRIAVVVLPFVVVVCVAALAWRNGQSGPQDQTSAAAATASSLGTETGPVGAKPGGSGLGNGASTGREGATSSTTRSPSAGQTTSSAPSTSRQAQPPTTRKGDRLIALSALPSQAQQTWRLIQRGGPFPYDRDGVVFENRERLLPSRARGYYHEYTVETPGEDDRGARRLITGDKGELFYTDDHYGSFSVVDPAR